MGVVIKHDLELLNVSDCDLQFSWQYLYPEKKKSFLFNYANLSTPDGKCTLFGKHWQHLFCSPIMTTSASFGKSIEAELTPPPALVSAWFWLVVVVELFLVASAYFAWPGLLACFLQSPTIGIRFLNAVLSIVSQFQSTPPVTVSHCIGCLFLFFLLLKKDEFEQQFCRSHIINLLRLNC